MIFPTKEKLQITGSRIKFTSVAVIRPKRITSPMGYLLGKVGQQIAIQTRITIDDRLDLGHRFVVVFRIVDADPKLGKVRADDLIGNRRATDGGSKVQHNVDSHQLLACTFGDAALDRTKPRRIPSGIL